MEPVNFSKKTISQLCEEHNNSYPDSLLLSLYKHIYGETWEKIERLNGFPKVSKTTAEFILEEIQKKCPDKINELMMLWVNKGFSIDNDIDDWKFIPAEYELC